MEEQYDAVQERFRKEEDIQRMENADIPRRFKRILKI